MTIEKGQQMEHEGNLELSTLAADPPQTVARTVRSYARYMSDSLWALEQLPRLAAYLDTNPDNLTPSQILRFALTMLDLFRRHSTDRRYRYFAQFVARYMSLHHLTASAVGYRPVLPLLPRRGDVKSLDGASN